MSTTLHTEHQAKEVSYSFVVKQTGITSQKPDWNVQNPFKEIVPSRHYQEFAQQGIRKEVLM